VPKTGDARQLTSLSFPVATSKTNPRIASLCGMNGLALILATDWRTSSCRSEKASADQAGLIPVSSWMARLNASSVNVSMPHVLDEPTTGMDVEGRRSFWASIRKDAEQGRTVLFATHYLEEADAYADRIILLRHGQKLGVNIVAWLAIFAVGAIWRFSKDTARV